MGVITVSGGRYNVDNVFQWDKDQILEIRGLSLTKKPEIHFIQDTIMDRAIVKQSDVDNAGIITVMIPNSLLQSAHPIKVYVCGYEESTFKTYCDLCIQVIPRGKPADYKLDNDPELYSFTKLEYKVNNFNDLMLDTVRSWITDNLTTSDPSKLLSARQGKVLADKIKAEEDKTGVLSDLTTTVKSNLVNAINSLVKSVSERFGDLATLKTRTKNNIVGAVNEIKDILDQHNHDTRYYTETEIDNKTGNLNSLNTSVKNNLVGSINELNGAVNNVSSALGGHKNSADHDTRYYLKNEVDRFLTEKQDAVNGVILTRNDIIDNLETNDATKALSASKGVSLNRGLLRLTDKFATHVVHAGSSIELIFNSRFTGFIATDSENDPSNIGCWLVCSYGVNPGDVFIHSITQGSNIKAVAGLNKNSVVISNLNHDRFNVSTLVISGHAPTKGGLV